MGWRLKFKLPNLVAKIPAASQVAPENQGASTTAQDRALLKVEEPGTGGGVVTLSLYCTQRERTVSREEMVPSRMLSCGSIPSRVSILQRYINESSNDAQITLI